MTSLGFLNTDVAVQAAIEEEMPEVLEYIRGNQKLFKARLIRKANTLKSLRKIAQGDSRGR